MSNSQDLETYPVLTCDVRWQYIGLPLLAFWPLDSLEGTKITTEVSYHIIYVNI